MIQPAHGRQRKENWQDGIPVARDFRYASNTNSNGSRPRLSTNSSKAPPLLSDGTEHRIQ